MSMYHVRMVNHHNNTEAYLTARGKWSSEIPDAEQFTERKARELCDVWAHVNATLTIEEV